VGVLGKWGWPSLELRRAESLLLIAVSLSLGMLEIQKRTQFLP
jgi:hypothetical protein